MSKHTPGPWIVREFPTYNRAAVQPWIMDAIPDGPGGKVVANAIASCTTTNPNCEANAAFIVRACNAHDDLLAACKALREAALNLRGEVVVTGEMTAKTLEPMFAADDLAQAAIAKAEEPTP